MADFMGNDQQTPQRPRAQYTTQAPSFSQLQQQGQARPPMPSYTQGYYGVAPQGVAGFGQPQGPAQGMPGQPQQPNVQPQVQSQPYTGIHANPGSGPVTQPAQPQGGTPQQNGVTPQPTVPTGAGEPAQSGLNQQMQDFITNWMKNTNPYTQQTAQDIFNTLSTQAGHEFDVQRQLAQEQSARQGLSSSTLAQGRLGDIGIRQAEAKNALAAQIAQQAAMTNAQSMQAALQAALGVSQNNFSQEYQTNLFNSGQDQLYNQILQALLGVS